MRKSITKTVRFEVFKRDSFTCQYCGNAAPNVILEIDHINPVSKGGKNNIINLITSCFDCNRGKSNKQISDDSQYKLQINQLKLINEKRQQLEMLAKWQDELLCQDDFYFNMFNKHLQAITNYAVKEHSSFKNKCIQNVKKYGISEISECIRISFERYGDPEFFEMIFKIAKCRETSRDNPIIKHVYYLRAILRNRIIFHNNEKHVFRILKHQLECGTSFEYLKDLVSTCRNWTEFKESLEYEIYN